MLASLPARWGGISWGKAILPLQDLPHRGAVKLKPGRGDVLEVYWRKMGAAVIDNTNIKHEGCLMGTAAPGTPWPAFPGEHVHSGKREACWATSSWWDAAAPKDWAGCLQRVYPLTGPPVAESMSVQWGVRGAFLPLLPHGRILSLSSVPFKHSGIQADNCVLSLICVELSLHLVFATF